MKKEILVKSSLPDSFILMADISGSRKKEQNKLMSDFKSVTKAIGKNNADLFLSPITITLGDEFQCVARDLLSSINIIFKIEEKIIKEKKEFKLRYALNEGKIETPINKANAHEMMGSGLTKAREMLTTLKKGSHDRFVFCLQDAKLSANLGLAFNVYQSLVDDWRVEKDFPIVSEFMELDDYKKVAEKLQRDRSLIWKRGRHLKMEQYKAIKNVIEYMAAKP